MHLVTFAVHLAGQLPPPEQEEHAVTDVWYCAKQSRQIFDQLVLTSMAFRPHLAQFPFPIPVCSNTFELNVVPSHCLVTSWHDSVIVPGQYVRIQDCFPVLVVDTPSVTSIFQ